MPDILVCAEAETREEAEAFVSKLGARPQMCSLRNFKQLDEAKLLLIFLKGPEPSRTLRDCLRRVSHNSTLHVVVYTHTHPSDDYQAADLGKIIGEYRPRNTFLCFDSDEVEEFLEERAAPRSKEKKRSSFKTVAGLRGLLDLTQLDLASALDVTPRTVQNWERRGGPFERGVRELVELYELASKYVGGDHVAAWMDGPNDAFQKRTPRGMIREGKTRDVILEFQRLATGEPL